MMGNSTKAVLVLGATGKQGGAVTKHLLANGWKVRALVRDPNKEAAQTLRSQGVEVVQGDLNNPASITEAMQGMYGAFSVQSTFDAEEEERQGKAVADAAKTVGIAHLVYSSVLGANLPMGIPLFAAKDHIEQHIHALKLPATILRPAMFMENFHFLTQQVNGQFLIPYIGSPNRKVQVIAAYDIGAFAALAFDHPDIYLGKTLDIAGDEPTWTQIAAAMSKALGSPVSYQSKPETQEPTLEAIRKVTAFLEQNGDAADIPALRQRYPQLLTFEAWSRQQQFQGQSTTA
jgi:uncharacterized protein YbjT (DUF2867 family)